MSADREALEREALMAVCSCEYYDLADAIDGVSNEDLQDIIEGRHQCGNPECPYKMATEFVQDLTKTQGIGLIEEDGSDVDGHLSVLQYYGPREMCELFSDTCSYDGILWSAGDMGSPYLCTRHEFPIESNGYEFCAVEAVV
jgi:hypothetical protein